ncbi:MAG: DNA adenine methylase [Treponema sp.]|jgi:DNA adenine methylase|nr:DNA adenine methylase [Treponema sp.]
MDNKRRNFTAAYAGRLDQAQIENCDALRIIKSRDVPDGFFYLDPPYVGADQGHYDGYTQEDFDKLLEILETLKGKFLLSSFRNKGLAEVSKRNGWYTIEIKMVSSMTVRFETKDKIEVLTTNYPIVVEKPPELDVAETGRIPALHYYLADLAGRQEALFDSEALIGIAHNLLQHFLLTV